MLRITSSILLGLVLALPLTASASENSDAKPLQVAAVASTDAVPGTTAQRVETPSRETKRSSEREREIRGARTGDPGVRFNNPYAFPLQTLPISLPNLTGMGL